jgi:hypothetical protein
LKDIFMKIKKRLLLAVSASVLAIAGTVSAGPLFSYITTYYSDNTQSTAVGESFTSCKGAVIMLWGTKSRYRSAPQPEDLCPGP